MVAVALSRGSRLCALGKSRACGESGDSSDSEHLCEVHDFFSGQSIKATLVVKMKAESKFCRLIYVKSILLHA